MKCLTINASPHNNSVTERFCKTFEEIMPSQRINLHDDPPPICRGRYKKGSKWQKAVLDADMLFIATPTYWYNIPSILKAFLDDITAVDSQLWQDERYLYIAVHAPEGGEIGTINALMAPFNMMGFTIPACGYVYYRGTQDRWVWKELRRIAQDCKDS
jgi:multimeric flavodoxin WrbA